MVGFPRGNAGGLLSGEQEGLGASDGKQLAGHKEPTPARHHLPRRHQSREQRGEGVPPAGQHCQREVWARAQAPGRAMPLTHQAGAQGGGEQSQRHLQKHQHLSSCRHLGLRVPGKCQVAIRGKADGQPPRTQRCNTYPGDAGNRQPPGTLRPEVHWASGATWGLPHSRVWLVCPCQLVRWTQGKGWGCWFSHSRTAHEGPGVIRPSLTLKEKALDCSDGPRTPPAGSAGEQAQTCTCTGDFKRCPGRNFLKLH